MESAPLDFAALIESLGGTEAALEALLRLAKSKHVTTESTPSRNSGLAHGSSSLTTPSSTYSIHDGVLTHRILLTVEARTSIHSRRVYSKFSNAGEPQRVIRSNSVS